MFLHVNTFAREDRECLHSLQHYSTKKDLIVGYSAELCGLGNECVFYLFLAGFHVKTCLFE